MTVLEEVKLIQSFENTLKLENNNIVASRKVTFTIENDIQLSIDDLKVSSMVIETIREQITEMQG